MPTSPRDRFQIVLVSPRNPLNIGAAARAMSNFGFAHLRVVNPYEVAFREARSAVGASQILAEAKEYSSVSEAVADCTLVVGTTAVRNRELQHPLRELVTGARLLQKRTDAERVAILFGSEKRGLSNDDLSHCHWLLHIPTMELHPSMNLGQAVAICLYELGRSPMKPSRAAKDPKATAKETERITSLLFNVLVASGYLKPKPGAASQEKIRRFTRRLGLTAEDATTLLGMLRQVAWKLGTGADHEESK